MLSWIKSLFASPPTTAPASPTDERELFRYWDGEKHRQIDPLLANRLIWSHSDCDFLADGKMALNPTKTDGTAIYPLEMVIEAEDRLMNMTREVFGVRAFSEAAAGLTMNETQQLLADFFAYRNELKKKLNSSRMQLPVSTSTEAAESADSAPPPSPPNTLPDCGCTGSESSVGEPGGPLKPSAAA